MAWVRVISSMNFAEFEHEGWVRVASKYEKAWSGLMRLFIESLLDATQVESGQQFLDVDHRDLCRERWVRRSLHRSRSRYR